MDTCIEGKAIGSYWMQQNSYFQKFYSVSQPNFLIDDRWIQNHFTEMLTDMYHYYPYNQKILIQRDASKGIYMKLYWDKEDFEQANSFIWDYRRLWGIVPENRYCKFYVDRYLNNTLVKRKNPYIEGACLSINQDLFRSLESMQLLYHKMEEFSPKWIQMDISTAELLIEYIERQDPKPIKSIVYCELLAHYIPTELRCKIRNLFKGCIVKVYFCSPECGGIAYEKTDKQLHVIDQSVVVGTCEKVKILKEGETGEIC